MLTRIGIESWIDWRKQLNDNKIWSNNRNPSAQRYLVYFHSCFPLNRNLSLTSVPQLFKIHFIMNSRLGSKWFQTYQNYDCFICGNSLFAKLYRPIIVLNVQWNSLVFKNRTILNVEGYLLNDVQLHDLIDVFCVMSKQF